MSFLVHRIKKRVSAFTGHVADWALLAGIVIFGGLGSSWYMVEAGTDLTTLRAGPWVMWKAAARTDADPYTRAHFARLGALPLSSEVANTFVARTDSEGRRLHSSCDYVVEGPAMTAHWWSIAVFDARGRLIRNAADRYVFTSDTAAISANNKVTITLARDSHASNWLPIGGAGRLALVMTTIELGYDSATEEDRDPVRMLPEIKRGACR